MNSGAAAAVQRANQGGEPLVDRRYVTAAAASNNPSGINSVSVSRLQAAGGKEKYGERRNPTILRKSKCPMNHYKKNCLYSHHRTMGAVSSGPFVLQTQNEFHDY